MTWPVARRAFSFEGNLQSVTWKAAVCLVFPSIAGDLLQHPCNTDAAKVQHLFN